MKKFMDDQQNTTSPLEINLTPLIDVVFILLIFFMVSSSFEKKSTVPIQRPQASSAETMPQKAKSLLISVTSQGEIFLEGNPVTLEQLKTILLHRVVQSSAISVLIDIDQSTTTGTLVTLMDQIRLAGIADIAILSQKKGN